MSKKAQTIPPEAYPQLVSKAQAGALAQILRSPATAATGNRVLADKGESLRGPVLTYVQELEAAGGNLELVSEKAHEIRGFAETAGMISTGRIADALCHYFDDCQKLGAVADPAVVALHVSAIGRTARDPDPKNRMNDVVAKELSVLAARKLAEHAGKSS